MLHLVFINYLIHILTAGGMEEETLRKETQNGDRIMNLIN